MKSICIYLILLLLFYRVNLGNIHSAVYQSVSSRRKCFSENYSVPCQYQFSAVECCASIASPSKQLSQKWTFSELSNQTECGKEELFISVSHTVKSLQLNNLIYICMYCSVCICHTVVTLLLGFYNSKQLALKDNFKWFSNNSTGKKSRNKHFSHTAIKINLKTVNHEEHSTNFASEGSSYMEKKSEMPFWKQYVNTTLNSFWLFPAHESMANESIRLATFKHAQLPVSSILLAKAGFFFIVEQRVTKCFSCDIAYKAWKTGDSPCAVHMKISPSCDFVASLMNLSENNSDFRSQPSSLNDTKYDSYSAVANGRLHLASNVSSGFASASGLGDSHNSHKQQSYDERDSGISSGISSYKSDPTESTKQYISSLKKDSASTSLSGLGSYRSTQDDSMNSLIPSVVSDERLPATSSQSVNTKSGNILSSHKTIRESGSLGPPEKDRIMANTQIDWENVRVPQPQLSKFNVNAAKDFLDLGIVVRKAARPEYAVLQTRLNTFAHWPADKAQNPQELAECGFYFTGLGDGVRCFFCNAGIKNWRPGDYPWIEHCKHFPRCGYMIQSKGAAFIRDAQQNPKKLIELYYGKDKEEDIPDGAQCEVDGHPDMKKLLKTPAAESLKDLKYSEATLETVIQKYMEENDGSTDFCAEDLLKIILDEMDEEPESTGGSLSLSEPMCINTPDMPTSASLRQAEEENKSLKEVLTCKVCLERNSSIVFLPCGHLVSCLLCAYALKNCPLCRQHVKGTVRANLD